MASRYRVGKLATFRITTDHSYFYDISELVVGGIIFLNILWSTIKYKSFSLPIAMAGVFFIRLRWIIAVISGLYFAVIQNYLLAFLAVLWPVLCALIVVPGKLNRMRTRIVESMGYDSELQIKSILAQDDPSFAEERISLQLPGKQKKMVMPFVGSIRTKRSQI